MSSLNSFIYRVIIYFLTLIPVRPVGTGKRNYSRRVGSPFPYLKPQSSPKSRVKPGKEGYTLCSVKKKDPDKEIDIKTLFLRTEFPENIVTFFYYIHCGRCVFHDNNTLDEVDEELLMTKIEITL